MKVASLSVVSWNLPTKLTERAKESHTNRWVRRKLSSRWENGLVGSLARRQIGGVERKSLSRPGRKRGSKRRPSSAPVAACARPLDALNTAKAAGNQKYQPDNPPYRPRVAPSMEGNTRPTAIRVITAFENDINISCLSVDLRANPESNSSGSGNRWLH